MDDPALNAQVDYLRPEARVEQPPPHRFEYGLQAQLLGLDRYPGDADVVGPMVVEMVMRIVNRLGDVDLAIFTQVRKPSIELVMRELGLPPERAHTVMEKWGYTGSACVGLAFDDAVGQDKVAPGDLVIFVGSGVGYNQAAAAFRLGEPWI